MNKLDKISIVSPCFNEQHCVVKFLETLSSQLEMILLSNRSFCFEVIIVDDGSTDQTLAVLRKYCTERVSSPALQFKYISFTRNFGHQAALSAGIRASSGDAVIMMDSDLQHPPSLIPLLIEEWKRGARVCNTVRTKDENISSFKLMTSKLFYRLMSLLTRHEIKEGTADFRLIDREVVNALLKIRDPSITYRVLIPTFGFKTTYIEFKVENRYAGATKYNLGRMFGLSLSAITSHSILPLRIASLLGVLSSSLSFLYLIYAVVCFFSGFAIPGWTSIIASMSLIAGIQMLMLGIIGEYLGRLFLQMKDHPYYIIKEAQLDQ